MDLLVPRWSLKMIWFGYGTLLCHQVGWPHYIDMTLILGTKKATPVKMLPTWNWKMATIQTSSRSTYHSNMYYHIISDIDIDILVSGLLNSHLPADVRSIFHRHQLTIDMTRERALNALARRFQKIPRTITLLPLPRPSWKSMMNMADLCLISVRKEPWASEWRANF